MKLSADRETLLGPLSAVSGVVERRQTMPILANVLLVAKDGRLAITATDLEVELVASVALDVAEDGEVTVPGRKLLDICRALPEGAKIELSADGEKVQVKSGRSRFSLSTLSAQEFPTVDEVNAQHTLTVPQADVKSLLDRTHFCMAHQDVRYYLNGLLVETEDGTLRTVATDGHRLAMAEIKTETGDESIQVIVPRKGVMELNRLLSEEGDVKIQIGSNHIRVEVGDIRMTSKLIDGRFPDYERVVPKGGSAIHADRETLRQALQRTAILSNEKYRGIRLQIDGSRLVIQAHNPEQEEAEEEVEVEYEGEALEIGFNVNYLLDAMGAIETEGVELSLVDANSSCLIYAPGDDSCKYVVMPMRL